MERKHHKKSNERLLTILVNLSFFEGEENQNRGTVLQKETPESIKKIVAERQEVRAEILYRLKIPFTSSKPSEAVECEMCDFICAYRYIRSGHIVKKTWIDGCVQHGKSKKYPKKIGFYCPEHYKKINAS